MKKSKNKRKAKPRKVLGKPKSKPRKYFGTPSVLMINTIIHAAIQILRRERQRLRRLLAKEYADLKELEKTYPAEIQALLANIETETERLQNGILAET